VSERPPYNRSDDASGFGKAIAEARRVDARDARRRMWLTVIMGVLILIPSMYGFLGKFIEFIHIYRGEPGGEFAVAPILNYLLASAGFFCMLLWAAWNGMFHDVEKPKYDFLENEARLESRRPTAPGSA
jgi:hypothetical protein